MQGKFDRVHVGAACPPSRIAALKKLLRPSGGIIVTPVTTSDLQRISVSSDCVRVETLSRVRYSNLEVRPRATGGAVADLRSPHPLRVQHISLSPAQLSL